ncbi:unnamed protein product [Moneuplotes crassus]|uniref:Nop domain-containing protein n=2 Tax=Euplotes crassus TaxID=5936 RepID=A0AAD1XEC6_EUPCR|nr:unnamed protein product [Moneuplotes crassus]
MAGKLTDDFLKDLEDLSDEEQVQGDIVQQEVGAGQEEDKIPEISKLKNDKEYSAFLEAIEEDLNTIQPADKFINLEKADPIYALIKKANHYLMEIENEINICFKEIRDIYLNRFSELESIVYDPIQYTKCVKAIGNENDFTKVDFKDILPNQTIMNITVAASVNQSTDLPEKVHEKLMYYCDDILTLDEQKKRILHYLENRMHYIAPNVLEILGCSVTAKIISAAGGIKELSEIPAGNIQVLGAQKKVTQGFSTQNLGLHVGHIGEVPMVKKAPANWRKQIIRMFSTKTVLAARVDAAKKHLSGQKGKELLQQIIQRFGKVTEAQKISMKKPLPKPVEKKSRKRGGRKFANMRKRLEMSEYAKMINTVKFGEEAQEEIGLTGIGMGMLGVSGTGKLRATASKNNKVKLMKKKTELNKPALPSGSTHDGLQSSLVLASNAGIELINPELLKEQVKEQQTYFNTKAGFSTVIQSRMNKNQ